MTQIFLEQPFYLGLLLAPIMLVLLGIWSRTRSVGAARVVLVALLLSVLLFVVQALVQTDREKLRSATRQLANAVEQSDVAGILALVAPQPNFGHGRSRDDFDQHLRYLLGKYTVVNPSLSRFDIQLRDATATLVCRSRCLVKTLEWSFNVPAKWQITFNRIGDQWLITNIKPLEIAGRQYTSFWAID